ncbi:WecB/TagA/CpsF family glycosyltransferase [Candidatus Gracilibacteria bacterium]|nr:WecB/TagA/CpsF family glycosyltransferase [Candidatus Gracilibacteria bacterium]
MKIFGLQLSNTSANQIFAHLPGILAGKKGKKIFTPNPEILLKQAHDSEFKDILEQADYLVPDGIGLYIAAQMLEYDNKLMRILLLPYFFFNLFFRISALYKKYGERICGSDLTKLLLEYSIEHDIRITVLDPYYPKDAPKVASQKDFQRNLLAKFPGLKFDFFVYKPDEILNIISEIKNSDSQIVFSTFGMKSQEQCVLDVMKQCPNIKLGLGVGSSFDYFIGFQKRASPIWSSLGLEWLYRLIFSHNRRRQMSKVWNAVFVFLWKVIKN